MKRKVVIMLLTTFLIVAWIIRFTYINKNVKDAKIEVYEIGKDVQIEDNYFVEPSENMQGYEIIVKEANILDYKDYLKKYNIDQMLIKNEYPPEKLYDVHITLRNTGNTNGGIYFRNYILQSIDSYSSINEELYGYSNPKVKDGSLAVALRPHSEMDFHLPYNLIKRRYTRNTWKNMGGYPTSLVVTKYPIKKMITIVKKQ